MKKIFSQFVPYEIAVTLKGAGFDEPCFGVYDISSILSLYAPSKSIALGFKIGLNSELDEITAAAPLYQQVFDWLELQNIRIHDCWIFFERKWSVSIFNIPTGNRMWPNSILAPIEPDSLLYSDKREAWNAAITEALNLLKNG